MGIRRGARVDTASAAGNSVAPRGMVRDGIAALLLVDCQPEGQPPGSAIRTHMECAVQGNLRGALRGATSGEIRNASRNGTDSTLPWARIFRSHWNAMGIFRRLWYPAGRYGSSGRRVAARDSGSQEAAWWSGGTAKAHRQIAISQATLGKSRKGAGGFRERSRIPASPAGS